jgi:hypothetical protein
MLSTIGVTSASDPVIPPEARGALFLGQQALQGERGVLRISPNLRIGW